MEELSTLAARMAALKATHDTNVTSKDKTPTPLWVFLYLYTQSKGECYINHMKGARKLAEYLQPIEFPTHTAVDENYTVPDILRTYEMTKLAELLVPRVNLRKAPDDKELLTIRKAERAILYSMYSQVIPLIY